MDNIKDYITQAIDLINLLPINPLFVLAFIVPMAILACTYLSLRERASIKRFI